MTINKIYRHFLETLNSIYEKNEAANITQMVFEKYCRISKSDIIKQPDLLLNENIVLKLNNALHELLNHRPVQYVVGECEFYKMKIKVNESVLIPRPETEELIEITITNLGADSKIKILDIGTGSGCIAVALKKNIQNAEIVSIDISKDALTVAKDNALNNDASVHFMNIDFLNEETWNSLGIYDCIISNPPYIPNHEIGAIEKNVKDYEPHLALFVPNDNPLIFYEKILKFSETHLQESGKIFLEIHKNFGKELIQLFNTEKLKAELKKDMFGNDRFVIVTRCR